MDLVDADRRFFKAEVGFGVRTTPFGSAVCAHAILEDEFPIVPDMLRDPRFDDNPLVRGEPHLRFYAGALLKTAEEVTIDILHVLDHPPRDLTALRRKR